jgi:hypothetical protein
MRLKSRHYYLCASVFAPPVKHQSDVQLVKARKRADLGEGAITTVRVPDYWPKQLGDKQTI